MNIDIIRSDHRTTLHDSLTLVFRDANPVLSEPYTDGVRQRRCKGCVFTSRGCSGVHPTDKSLMLHPYGLDLPVSTTYPVAHLDLVTVAQQIGSINNAIAETVAKPSDDMNHGTIVDFVRQHASCTQEEPAIAQ